MRERRERNGRGKRGGRGKRSLGRRRRSKDSRKMTGPKRGNEDYITKSGIKIYYGK